MLIPNPKSPNVIGRIKPQEQDSPLAQFGRFGLYRTLSQLQTPKVETDDPVSAAFMRQAGAQPPRISIGRGFRR